MILCWKDVKIKERETSQVTPFVSTNKHTKKENMEICVISVDLGGICKTARLGIQIYINVDLYISLYLLFN